MDFFFFFDFHPWKTLVDARKIIIIILILFRERERNFPRRNPMKQLKVERIINVTLGARALA